MDRTLIDADVDEDRARTLRALATVRYATAAQPARVVTAGLLLVAFWGAIRPLLLALWASAVVLDAAVAWRDGRRVVVALLADGADRHWARSVVPRWLVSAAVHAALPVLAATTPDVSTRYLLLLAAMGIATMGVIAAQGFCLVAFGGVAPVVASAIAVVAAWPHPVRPLVLIALYGGFMVQLNRDISRTTSRFARRTVQAELLNDALVVERERLIVAQHALRQANVTLCHDATHDALTGLANRALLTESLDRAIADCPDDLTVGVLYADLDRFKEVNDAFGHDAGDELLRQVAERLVRLVRPGDIVARVGGDEFVVVLPRAGAHVADIVAARAREVLAEPFLLQSAVATIGVAIGVSHARRTSTSRDVLREADTAMYACKVKPAR